MSDSDKVLTYEEAKELCKKAFDGGIDYGTESMRYNCNAVAYDWEHWLKKNERLFKPRPTIEDVLHKLVGRAQALDCAEDEDKLVAEYAAKLRLAEGDAE